MKHVLYLLSVPILFIRLINILFIHLFTNTIVNEFVLKTIVKSMEFVGQTNLLCTFLCKALKIIY